MVVLAPETRPPVGRLLVTEAVKDRGFGVTLCSTDGRRETLRVVDAGVLVTVRLGTDAETSDIGGEGGSMSSAFAAGKASESGGVVTMGELAVELGECSVFLSNVGDDMTERSVEMWDRWRASCFLSLSWSSSASILRSASSSRRRCASMRRVSRSCSPSLISSSIMTARSIATLYFDSRSSREDVVFRACRSKSSLATSMSRSFSCMVLLVSRSVVISFSNVF